MRMDSNARFICNELNPGASLELSVRAWGDSNASGVILLHGGGQTCWAWERTAIQLAKAGYYAVAPDLRGHGDSQWADPDHYELDAFVSDLTCILNTLFERPPVVVGASLGGATALATLGEASEELASAVVLVDIAPQWESAGVDRILDFLSANRAGFDTLEAAADAVKSYLPHRNRAVREAGLRKNLRQAGDGRWYWRWDPAMLDNARESSKLWPERLEVAASNVTIPMLLISGGKSDVISDQSAESLLAVAPNASHRRLDDAHHMVAGDDNDRFTQALLDFLVDQGLDTNLKQPSELTDSEQRRSA